MIELLRPGYTPPTRFDISGKLLDVVHEKSMKTAQEILTDKTVCMSLDGWSNVHNEPVICATITTSDAETFLADTVDTSGQSHTADYLVSVAVNSIQKCEQQF
jgi:autotransporter adhesin